MQLVDARSVQRKKMASEVFAERLSNLRKRRKMSRKVLGELCGLSKNMIARYEKGERIPNIDTLTNICDVFEVSADYMLGRRSYL